MKIVTPGKIYYFQCPVCGCEFVEGIKKLDVIPCFKTTLKCPTCGEEVEGVSDETILKRMTGVEEI